MARVIAIAIALMAGIGHGYAEAAVFVVDATPSPCLSSGTSVPTILAAVTLAAAGDVIYVCPGTYSETVRVPADKPDLQFLGVARPTILHGAGVYNGFVIQASGVRIQGFAIVDMTQCGVWVAYPPTPPFAPPSRVVVIGNLVRGNHIGVCFTAADGSEIRNNTIESNDFGINAGGAGVTDLRIIGNRVHNNAFAGIRAVNGGSVHVERNVVSENGEVGIAFVQGSTGVIQRNTVFRNWDGISVVDTCCFEIKSNLVSESDSTGIYIENASDCSVEENSVTRNGGGDGIFLERVGSCRVHRNRFFGNIVGIATFLLSPLNSFTFNTASGNSLDCLWDGSGAPEFKDNRCRTEDPAGAWD